jgi:hypothetical protein
MNETSGSSDAPTFRYLRGNEKPAFLITLRDAVSKILSNNLLPYYTDHSVGHSDRLVKLVGDLIEPIQIDENGLSQEELTVLYAACYLHDIGMQYENVGSTNTILQMKLGQDWNDLTEGTRRDVLRRCHHKISAELVSQSSPLGQAPIGVTIPDEYRPDCIAPLCEAHGLDIKEARYKEVTQEVGDIRMDLLSALLRTSDILDESRRRVPLEKMRSLVLDISSQVHWWRHYYTRDVTIDQVNKTVWLHFEFPKDCREEYSNVVPQLQVPRIQEEFADHAIIFNRAGLGWSIRYKIADKAYVSAETMPDEVLAEMIKELYVRRTREAERTNFAVLQGFDEAQPLIARRLTELRSRQSTISTGEYLRELWNIARFQSEVGGKRSAWMLLKGEFTRHGISLDNADQFEIGMWLLDAMLEDNSPREALEVVVIIEQLDKYLSSDNNIKRRFLEFRARIMIEMCAYDDAVTSLEQAIQLSNDKKIRDRLVAELSELHLLQGAIDRALNSANDTGEPQ